MNQTILLTIDVEDWFQVENLKQWIPFSSWSSCELRVERNVHRLLDLFDETSEKVHATFFVLGWIAERLPHLVREIHGRCHEVASHGYYHRLCREQFREELKKDLSESRELLEDIMGASVVGYRAPSFSIDNESLKVVEDCGYLYDSSYNSFSMNGRYGKLNSKRWEAGRRRCLEVRAERTAPQQGKAQEFYELPISNLEFKTKNSEFKIILPWGGGGYFRLIPFLFFKRGVQNILNENSTYIFYMHPWEIDPAQPRINEVSWFSHFRHYTNLSSTRQKLWRLISAFKDCEFMTCAQYLAQSTQNEAILENDALRLHGDQLLNCPTPPPLFTFSASSG